MRMMLRAWIVFSLGIKRLLSERYRMATTIVGLVLIVAISVSISVYSDAVHYQRLVKTSPRYGDRPPFAFLFRYVAEGSGEAKWADVWTADRYVAEQAGDELGLPQKGLVRYLATDTFYLFSQDEPCRSDCTALAWASFAFASGLADHVDVVSGTFPSVSAPSRGEQVGVLVSQALADKLGLEVGDRLFASPLSEVDAGQESNFPVYMAGVWRASDPEDEFWFYSPKALEDILFVPEPTFADLVAWTETESSVALWYLLMDGSGVNADEVDGLLCRIDTAKDEVEGRLPGASLTISPESALLEYRRATEKLLFWLYASSLPILGFLSIFVGIVTQEAMERRRHETVALHCHGASWVQVAGVALWERLMLGLMAFVIGLPAGALGAWLIGRARGLLDLSMTSVLRVGWTATAIRAGVAAIGLATLVQAIPIVAASRRTVTTLGRERVDMMRWPWWHRAWVDLLLLAPVAYGYYVLDRQNVDVFDTPLFLLVPALATLALTLLTLRMLPSVLWLLAWVSTSVEGIGLFLAARTIVRRPALYAAPLVLLILTLSLSIFAASLAATLNVQLYDRVHYETGADIVVRELTAITKQEPYRPRVPPGESTDPSRGQRWVFRPVTDYLKIDGVEAAARVGRYTATVRPREGVLSGEFLGVDHWEFDSVAHWQDEYASASLRAMMDSLAAQPNGVLVPVDLMNEHGLVVGDELEMKVLAYGGVSVFDTKIVGAFEAFPTWSGDLDGGGSFFVGNLHYVFKQMGTRLPHDVWLRIEPDVDHEQVIEGVRALGIRVLTWEASPARIAEVQQRPERQGLFGVLSIGVMAAAFLTGIGLLQTAAYAFRRRYIEWGVLRAIGASTKQMVTVLIWELCLLLLTAVIVGTSLGVGSSHLFISRLQTNDGLTARWPPLTVQVAWPTAVLAWGVCGVLFAVSLVVLRALWLRVDASRAIISGGRG